MSERKFKIGVLVSGGGTNLQAIMDAVKSGDIPNTEISFVISNNANAYALTRAETAGIPAKCISPKSFTSEAVVSYNVDLVVAAGFLVIIPKAMIRAYKDRIINIHPSLIPSFCGTGYYGLKVHEAVLARGVKVTGATVHFVDEGTDTGPIIFQKAVDVLQDDTPKSLQLRVMEQAEWIILPKAIEYISRGLVSVDPETRTVRIKE